MQAADDVKLRDCLGISRCCRLESFFESHRVGARRVFLPAEGAETASRDADVRRIDMPVDVEVRTVAVHPLAHVIGKPPDGQDVSRPIKLQGIGGVEPFARHDFVVDRLKARVVSLEWMKSGHCIDDTAGDTGRSSYSSSGEN